MESVMNKLFAVAVAASLAVSAVASAASLSGAGATFPAPVYAKWAEGYKAKTGNSLNYQAIGSGGGIKQIIANTVDFGASDMPLKPDDLAKDGLQQFPTVIGGVVPVMNLPGIKAGEVKITGEILADIYRGIRKNWNDPVIASFNPGVKLPNLPITVVHRSDGSGTTFVFTSYLAGVSPDWKSNVGAATSVQWSAGSGAKGNDGVAASVKNTKGAIGYVEYAYATNNGLTIVDLQNKAGKLVKPTLAAFTAAAAKADWKDAKDFAVSMVNVEGDEAWPIVSTTFILLPKDPKDPAKSADVMKFFDWAYKDGSAAAEKLHYIVLPKDVVDNVRTAWKANVKGADGKSVYGE
jgi:phosphate transport system substrate-binding protein